MAKYLTLVILAIFFIVGSAYAPAAALDMRGETIYMIMVDRFYDGDSTNNTAVNPNQYSSDHSEWGKYFGGDLEGIRQKLDYLEAIGVTALWITPSCQNDPYLISGGTPYHGYDMMDLYRVEPHFGNWTTFDTLADGVHSRGMKLILDVNLNNGGYTGSGNLCRTYKNGVLKADYNDDYANWYHHLGAIPDDKWDDSYWVLNGDIFGMADLNQDQENVQRYLINGVAKWVWHGVDGFRLDAVKHVPTSFMRQFTDDMNKFAGWLGRPGIYAFGEYYGGGAYNSESISWSQSTNSALFDFNLASDIRDVELENKSFWDLWNNVQYRQSAYGTDSEGGSNSNWQVVWFDSQDWQRLMTVLIQKYNDETVARNRVDQSIVLLETLPGIPCIYYGTEQYLHNDSLNSSGVSGADPYNRPMMESWDTGTSAAKTLSVLSSVRKNNPALQYGDIQQRYITSSIFVYSRQWSDSAVVVALNNSGVAQDISVQNLPLPDGSYADVLHTGTEVDVTGGSAVFHLEPASSIVLVRGNTGAEQSVSQSYRSDQQYSNTAQETTSDTMTFDGRAIPSDFSGHLVATQDNFTWFGDADSSSSGSELDQLFMTNDSSSLQIGITGNLETNGNCWLIFLQTAPEGTSKLAATAGPPSGVVGSFAGTIMDDDFAPNWLLTINTSGGVVYADLVDLLGNTKRFLGSSLVNSGSGVLSGGDNPNGILIAFDNTNTAGVSSDPSRSISQTQTDSAAATTGAEIKLPFSDVKLSTSKPKIMVLLVGSSGYISDQCLPGFGGKFYNPGNPPIDFDQIPSLQYAQVQLTELDYSVLGSVSAVKTLPESSPVALSGMVVTGSYYPFSCYYVEDKNRTNGIRVRDTSGYLPSQGKTVTVQGFISTDSGERVINASSTSIGAAGAVPESLGMPGLSSGWSGLSNTGLLVTIWGKVTSKGTDELGNEFFYVDDGSNIWDGSYTSSGDKRIGIRTVISYVSLDIGSYVRVTGISGIQMVNDVPQRRILPRGAYDVRVLD